MAINKDNLEKALSGSGNSAPSEPMPSMPKEEEIGYHKGALSTLVNERNELFKMLQVVEQIMQAHMKRLEELGIKIQTQDKK